MQLPTLTPLQPRLLASCTVTCLLVVICIAFQPRNAVYAAELPAEYEHGSVEERTPLVPPDDPDIDSLMGLDGRGSGEEGEQGGYIPDFTYFDRSLIGRQEEEVEVLEIGGMLEGDADAGTVKFFRVEGFQLAARNTEVEDEMLEGRGIDNASQGIQDALEQEDNGDSNDESVLKIRKRQAGKRIWISTNTCSQPTPNPDTLITGTSPQLELYVSTSVDNQKPGPNSTNDLATSEPIVFEGGYANFTMQTDSDVYIGVSAPELAPGWNGSYSFQIAATVDGYYHGYQNSTAYAFKVDEDSNSALFVTDNLATGNETEDVDQIREIQNAFTMYAFPDGTWNNIMGLQRSHCGIRAQFNVPSNNFTIDSSITTQFSRNSTPKARFHIQNLERNTTYFGLLAVDGSQDVLELPGGAVRAGGMVFSSFNWTTKATDSCQVLFGLDFCDNVAYAVPSNTRFRDDDEALKDLYDTSAKDYYANFTKSLQQVACNTTSTAQYSLARTCKDCERDYKTWLCSVLIPRCDDYATPQSENPHLMPRNINTPLPNGTIPSSLNSTLQSQRDRFSYDKSRNPLIDEEIKPGPYKELLPCEDLCFDIVRSCPAQMQFACPNPPARELSYGKREFNTPGNLACNFPGAVVALNYKGGAVGGVAGGVRKGVVVLVAGVVGMLLWV